MWHSKSEPDLFMGDKQFLMISFENKPSLKPSDYFLQIIYNTVIVSPVKQIPGNAFVQTVNL